MAHAQPALLCTHIQIHLLTHADLFKPTKYLIEYNKSVDSRLMGYFSFYYYLQLVTAERK